MTAPMRGTYPSPMLSCRFHIDNRQRSIDQPVAEVPEPGDTVEIEGGRFIVRSVTPIPGPHQDRMGMAALVFCRPADDP
jgi:hypothetical protein